MVMTFQESETSIIFILSLRAGGAGLNLTRANHVFHFDRWWNPAVENQATDRAFRIGQRRDVQVHKFVVAGTLEEHIQQLLNDKQNLADTIVGSGEQWLSELNTDQLRELLLLRREEAEERDGPDDLSDDLPDETA
jgi:SNF2 family DNA or RNA helicase